MISNRERLILIITTNKFSYHYIIIIIIFRDIFRKNFIDNNNIFLFIAMIILILIFILHNITVYPELYAFIKNFVCYMDYYIYIILIISHIITLICLYRELLFTFVRHNYLCNRANIESRISVASVTFAYDNAPRYTIHYYVTYAYTHTCTCVCIVAIRYWCIVPSTCTLLVREID